MYICYICIYIYIYMLHILHIYILHIYIYIGIVGKLLKDVSRMFAVTRTTMYQSTDPKLFFARIYKKTIEDLYLVTKKSEICIFCVI